MRNSDDSSILVDAVSLGRRHDGPPVIDALRSATLRIQRGEYISIVGPSGCGKSTLLNLLGLLDRPTSGSYRLASRDVLGLEESERALLRGSLIGFVYQAFHLLPDRSALENASMAGLYGGKSWTARSAQGHEALSQVGLGDRADALPRELSGGEQQRVAIARALAGRPQLLLADEPTGNLDSETTNSVLAVLDKLHADGLTIVLITHDSTVAGRAERCLRMSDGHLCDE